MRIVRVSAEALRGRSAGRRAQRAIGLAGCIAVLAGWAWQRLVSNDPDAALGFAAPDWLPLVAAAFAAVALAPLDRPLRRLRAVGALRWTALLLMVWVANGLPFDLFTAAGLIGHRTSSGDIVLSTVYWPGLVTRAFALTVVVVLALLAFARDDEPASARPATWYGYVAFALALPYPLLRLHWALGGTLGLKWTGAGGVGWEPLLIAIPWALAAAVSLFLVSPPGWLSRRLLLLAGWSATAIVAMIGPSAIWGFVTAVARGDAETGGIELWVFGLFYGSWFLWAIAGGAATRSYQIRSERERLPAPA